MDIKLLTGIGWGDTWLEDAAKTLYLMQLKKCCWRSAWFLSFFPTRCWHFTRRSNIAAPLRPLLPQMQWSRCNQWRQKARRGRFQQCCIFNLASRSSGNLWVKILLTSSQTNSFSAIKRIAVENRAIVTAAEATEQEAATCWYNKQQWPQFRQNWTAFTQ